MGGGEKTTHGLKKVAWGLMMKTSGLKEHILGLKEPIHFLRKPLYFMKAALDTLPEPIHFPPKKPRGFTPKRGLRGGEGAAATTPHAAGRKRVAVLGVCAVGRRVC